MPEVTRMQAFQLATGRHSHLYDELTPDLQDHIVRIVTVSIRNAFSIIVPAGAIALIASLFLSVSDLVDYPGECLANLSPIAQEDLLVCQMIRHYLQQE